MSKLKTLPEPLGSLRGHLNDCASDLFEESIRVTDVWVDPPDFRFGLSRNGAPFRTIRVSWPSSVTTAHSPAGEALARAVMDQIVEAVLNPPQGGTHPDNAEDHDLVGIPNIK